MPEDEAAPGSIEEQDLDSKDQEEVNPEDWEEAQRDQENSQEDRETNQGTRFTHARGSWWKTLTIKKEESTISSWPN